MVKTVTKHEASNGKAFDTAFEAWREELRAWLTATADNEAIANKIDKALHNERPEALARLAEIVTGLTATAPSVDRCEVAPMVPQAWIDGEWLEPLPANPTRPPYSKPTMPEVIP